MRRLLVVAAMMAALPVRCCACRRGVRREGGRETRGKVGAATPSCRGQAGDRGDPHRPAVTDSGLKELKDLKQLATLNLFNTE